MTDTEQGPEAAEQPTEEAAERTPEQEQADVDARVIAVAVSVAQQWHQITEAVGVVMFATDPLSWDELPEPQRRHLVASAAAMLLDLPNDADASQRAAMAVAVVTRAYVEQQP